MGLICAQWRGALQGVSLIQVQRKPCLRLEDVVLC